VIGLLFIALEFIIPGGVLAVLGGLCLFIFTVMIILSTLAVWLKIVLIFALFGLIWGVCAGMARILKKNPKKTKKK
jgi:membrane protein implicated in regulation of membrane protease activity